jgi:hypothetical protein
MTSATSLFLSSEQSSILAHQPDDAVDHGAHRRVATLVMMQHISINRSPLAMGLLTGKFSAGQALPANDVRSNTFGWMDCFKDGQSSPNSPAGWIGSGSADR